MKNLIKDIVNKNSFNQTTKVSLNDFKTLRIYPLKWYIERLAYCNGFDFKEYIKSNHDGFIDSMQINDNLFISFDDLNFNICVFDIKEDENVLTVELPFTNFNEILKNINKIEKLYYYIAYQFYKINS